MNFPQKWFYWISSRLDIIYLATPSFELDRHWWWQYALGKNTVYLSFRMAIHHFVQLLWMGELVIMNVSQLVALYFNESNVNCMFGFQSEYYYLNGSHEISMLVACRNFYVCFHQFIQTCIIVKMKSDGTTLKLMINCKGH